MDSTRTDSPQRTGSERNNWLLLALVALVSFGGAVLYAVVDDPDSPIYLAYFVVMAAAVAGIAFWWFGAHPPRLSGPRWGTSGSSSSSSPVGRCSAWFPARAPSPHG
ncbi:hypothetical protein [Brevibacterium pityocampae]|uniref:Uncharacterized protein n=1 Tax=Brevibacterium pityocampae TaxID=506594 RepID=A0ABP8JJM6_9MICO